MFKRTKVCAGVLAAIGSGLLVSAATAQTQPVERIEITGSAIKRVNAEGPAPVEVVTRKDIERTGATTVNELIRSIPSIDIFDQGELASNSPAGSGTANISMRGLDSSNVLVLLNGRRLPVNALYDSSGAGAAVDINMIPLSAIERVEILKDGGSAIYGADAVAGVVNIITKTNYTGGEVHAGYGQTTHSGDAQEKQAGIVAGFGDLDKDRFNVLVGLDMFKRDPVYRKDREISKSSDWRRFGARDGRSSFAPEGNVIDPVTGGLVGVPYTPCVGQAANDVCRYDFNSSLLTSINGADRLSGMAIANFQITPDIRAFAEIMAARTRDTFKAHPVPDYFVMPITNEAQRDYEIPCGRNEGDDDFELGCDKVYIAGRFMQGGPRITERHGYFTNLATGLEGTTGGFDWKVNVGRGTSRVTNKDSNYYNADLWTAATTGGLLNPTVSTNDPALVESLKVNPRRDGKATIEYFNAQIGGDAFQLPAGPVRYAVGFNYTREKLTDTPDELTQAGQVVGSIQQSAVEAKRNERAVFGELQIPVLKSLEAQLAARYDDYPSYSQTSPKVGLKYTLSPAFAVRASYTESFRAPVLKQLYGAREEGAITLTDVAQCEALGVALQPDRTCLINAYQVNGSNPDLKPEKGKTYNVGFVMEPVQNVNLSIDWWKIKKEDNISSLSIDDAIEKGAWGREGARTVIFTNLLNLAATKNSGVDLDGRIRFPRTPIGAITVQDLFTYYIEQRRQDTAADPFKDYVGTYATPRWRNNIRVTTETGPWTVSTQARMIGGFYDDDEPDDVTSETRKVGSHWELDLQGQYTGFAGWALTAGIKNLFDRMPPFSVTNALDNTYTQQGFAEVYNNRGRFWYVNASYTFK